MKNRKHWKRLTALVISAAMTIPALTVPAAEIAPSEWGRVKPQTEETAILTEESDETGKTGEAEKTEERGCCKSR